MTDLQHEYERWAELSDRIAAGYKPTEEEEYFCSAFPSRHPACIAELDLLDELGELDSAPDEDSRALVDAVLTRVDNGEVELPSSRPEATSGHDQSMGGLLVGLAAVACTALALWQLSEPRQAAAPQAAAPAPTVPTARAELVYTSGEVVVNGQTATVGPALLDEGTVIAAGDGGACFALDPDIDVCLGAGSKARLARTGTSHRVIELLDGKLAARLHHQPKGMKFSIVADGVWSTAIGTKFSVMHHDDEVHTTVLEGKVQVGSEDAGRMVTAHQRVHVSGLGHKKKQQLFAVTRALEAPDWALLHPTRLWTDPVSATLELRGAPASAQIRLDGKAIGIAPLSSLIPIGRHQLTVFLNGNQSMVHDFEVAAGETRVVSYQHAPPPVAQPVIEAEPAPRARAKTAKPSKAPAVGAALLLGEARSLMRQARWSQASNRYQMLRRLFPDSPEAATVLVPLGQVQLKHLHQPTVALAQFDKYLASGATSLRQEARHSRIRALAELSDKRTELQAIEGYLKDYPKSFQARGLRKRLSELRSTQ